MPFPLEPLADGADPWVLALERLEAKILDPDKSFYKFCVSASGFGRAPKVFAHKGAGADSVVYDPPIDSCPAVVLEVTNPAPPQDHGAGAERWTFTVLLYFKAFTPDGDQRKFIRAYHELIRTVFHLWRASNGDTLSSIPSVGYYMIPNDLTPEFSRPTVGLLCGKAAFSIAFTFSETILG